MDQAGRALGLLQLLDMQRDQPAPIQQLRAEVGLRQQRRSFDRRQQPDDGLEGVDLHPHIGIDPTALEQLVSHAAVPGAFGEQDHRQPGEIAHRQLRRQGQRVMLGNYQPQLILEQRDAAQTRLLSGRRDDPEIGFAFADRGDDLMGLAGNQLQLGCRVFLHVGVHQRRQCCLERGKAGAERYKLRLSFLELRQRFQELGTLLPLLQCIGVSKAAHLSKFQPFAEPVEQCNAEPLLQLGDFAGEGGLGQIELARSPVQAGMLHDSSKNVQIIKHKPSSLELFNKVINSIAVIGYILCQQGKTEL
ncbi:hypothetical protein D3C75_832300 [compost metagenome]